MHMMQYTANSTCSKWFTSAMTANIRFIKSFWLLPVINSSTSLWTPCRHLRPKVGPKLGGKWWKETSELSPSSMWHRCLVLQNMINCTSALNFGFRTVQNPTVYFMYLRSSQMGRWGSRSHPVTWTPASPEVPLRPLVLLGDKKWSKSLKNCYYYFDEFAGRNVRLRKSTPSSPLPSSAPDFQKTLADVKKQLRLGMHPQAETSDRNEP